MSKGELACTLPWREIVGEANISLSQMIKGELACTLPWREIEGNKYPVVAAGYLIKHSAKSHATAIRI